MDFNSNSLSGLRILVGETLILIKKPVLGKTFEQRSVPSQFGQMCGKYKVA